jgi:TonB-linked SusC/RagA family outer membrane protein
MNVKKKFLCLLALSVCTMPTLWANGIDSGTSGNAPVQQNSNGTISGKVTDKNGESLIGVTVKVKGTSVGTITDVNGSFSVNNVSPSSVLVFSYIGMNNQEIKVGAQTLLNVKLEDNSVNMNEVVVVGYGTQKKSDITGSVTSVSKERFTQIPVTNAMSAIEGAVAGVIVSNTSSVPGSAPNVQVRGVNSINASTNPLIIVDGIPFEGNISYINPGDIQSMEILKDASSVAIYGTRGANGVILITTKKGVSGKPVIQYAAYGGVESVAHVLHPRSGAEYVQKYADYISQTGQTLTNAVPNLYEIANYNAGKTTDWIKQATQQGIIQNHNISISGGTENTKYYVSGDYLSEKGVVKGYNYKRAGIRSNLETNVTDYLTTGVSLFLVSNNYDGNKVNLLNATAMSPYGQIMNNTTGKYQIYPMYPELLYTNPMIGTYNDSKDQRMNINTNFFAELKPKFIPGLKYRLNASYNYNPTNVSSYVGRDGNDNSGTASITDTKTTLWVIENILSYTKDWEKHHFDFTGLYSSQKNNYTSVTAGAVGFINDILSVDNLSAGAKQTSGSYQSGYSMVSQMGRLNYSYDSRYLITLTARRDGYSAFGVNTNKYATFPSVALGWNLSNESFMAGTKDILDQLKVRISYGKSGNMAIGVNQTSLVNNTVSYPFNGISNVTVLANILGNPNLHWETTKGLNGGIDFAILNSRISGSVDVYSNRTSDLLLKRNLPLITGYSNVWDNIGIVSNKGIDVTLKTVNVATKNFRWSTNWNFSTNKNMIVDLYGDKKSDIGNRWFIGKSLGAIYDYKMTGVWQTGDADLAKYGAKPGDLKFQDINNDSKIDAANDKVYQGSTQPKWIGGFTNTFDYKNFHLSIFIQTSQGSVKNDVDLNYGDETGRRNTPAEIGYWTAANKSNSRPALSYNNTLGYGYPRDNSFTRIKDVTLSYVFSPKILEHTFFKSLTLYASGRNLYTFTNWIGWDPEDTYVGRGSSYAATNNGPNNGTVSWTNNYPSVRSVVFGINVALK